MDKRQRLERGSILAFPGMKCHIEEVIGCGSNAIVYSGWYLDQLQKQEKHHVLIKELFPAHKQAGVRRGDDGRICVDDGEPEEFFQRHKKSFEAGNRIHLRLLEGCPQDIGDNLNSFEFNGTLYTILGFSGGRSLEDELLLGERSAGLKRYAHMILQLLDALSAFHESGYLHLDISPDNALIIGRQQSERMMLIDYNSAREIGDEDVAYLSFKEGYSAPEVEMGEVESICEASDLYSVTAIFYRMLMGRSLILEEITGSSAVDAALSPCLQDMPQTVKSLVKGILKKGLDVLPEERYQSIAQMRRAFAELIDRIDCVGVTHWALWESGRRSIEKLIRVNPSLSHVKDEAGMYPIRLEQDGRKILLEELLEEMLSPQGKSRLTVSPGGMGKTTLLLRAALKCGQRYTRSQPAVFYISLSGFSGADPRYIRSQILSSLRFKRETNTFDSAMHELEQLLGRTIKSGRGALPMVLLLLDGLNEVRGEIAPLLQEINLLSRMAGVRIMAASRSEVPALNLKTNRILNLTFEDVQKAAARKGVLLPQGEQLLQLVRTPLILSIYLTASENSQQLGIQNQDDLMRAYIKALYDKEIRDLPEHAPQRWQTDAALDYVLPAIAAETMKAGRRLTDAQLLGVVEQCYQVLTSKLLRQAFPQWAGWSREILGEAESAEAWYGLMVHDLLWQRLGLLMKDEQGGYSVFHQMIAEHLCSRHRENAAAIRKRRMIQGSIFALYGALVLAVCMGMYAAFFMVTPYDDEEASFVLSESRMAYEQFFEYYKGLDSLIALAEASSENISRIGSQDAYAGYGMFSMRRLWLQEELRQMDPFEAQYFDVVDTLKRKDLGNPELARETTFELMAQERKIVSWSKLPLDGYGVLELQHHLQERKNYYLNTFLPQFKSWYYQSFARDGSVVYVMTGARQYLTNVRQMLEDDVRICQLLYDLYIAPHMKEEQLAELITFNRTTKGSELMNRVAKEVDHPNREERLNEFREDAIRCRGRLEGFDAAHEISAKGSDTSLSARIISAQLRQYTQELERIDSVLQSIDIPETDRFSDTYDAADE